MAYGIPQKRPVQLAPNMGTTPSYPSAPFGARRVQMQVGRPSGPMASTGASRRPLASMGASRRPPPRPGQRPLGGPPQEGPLYQGGPQQTLRDPFQTTPLAAAVEGLGAAMGMARIPGVGQPGSERGMTNVRRRRLG